MPLAAHFIAYLRIPLLGILVAHGGRLFAAEAVQAVTKRVGSAAIVVSNRGGPAFEDQQLALEDLVSARLGELGLRVISREMVQGNLRSFVAPSAPRNEESNIASSGPKVGSRSIPERNSTSSFWPGITSRAEKRNALRHESCA